jgi:hypothetical protein
MSNVLTRSEPLLELVSPTSGRASAPLSSKPVLPVELAPAYYLDDFIAVIDGVRARYGNMLTPEESSYLAKLDSLSRPAKQLFTRLVNRRGPFFRVEKIIYPEIADIDEALLELTAKALLEHCRSQSASVDVLTCFTHAELIAALGNNKPAGVGRKGELISWIGQWEGYDHWMQEFFESSRVIRVPKSDPWHFVRFLFFGELRENLSDFVTRALGRVVTETIEPTELRPLFTCRRQIEDAYRMANLYNEFRNIRATRTGMETLLWWQAQSIERHQLMAGQDWFDRLTDRLGRTLERDGENDEAATLYAACPVAPARERLARLLIKSGKPETATGLLREMLAAPCHAEEAYAARQIVAKLEKRSRRSEARHYELKSKTLYLDYPHGGVEASVLAHYREQGWQGVHSENWIWNATFGLLLWDIIYDPKHGVFHSPLQFAPSDLYDPLFYDRRRTCMEARLATLENPAIAFGFIQRHFHDKYGVNNPFVSWHENLLEVVEVLLNHVSSSGIASALRHIASNIRRHSSGLPDLFIWNEADYRFIEIKAENDHLSGHQYEWLRVLAAAGINVSLERVTRPVDEPDVSLPSHELSAAHV